MLSMIYKVIPHPRNLGPVLKRKTKAIVICMPHFFTNIPATSFI